MISAVVLAAGQSKRMGAFKPLLPFGNQTIIEASIDYLRRGGVESVVVVLGHRSQEVSNRVGHLGVKFALNADADSEMTASINAGIAEISSQTGATLITPADLPAIPPHVVSQLIDAWKGGAKLIIPTWQNRGGHPVLVDLEYRHELQTLDPTLGLKSLFTTHQTEVKRLPVDSPFIARDIDKWDDYVALYTEVFGHAPPPLPPRDETN